MLKLRETKRRENSMSIGPHWWSDGETKDSHI